MHIASANLNQVPLEIMKKLLISGADPNPKNHDAPSPLWCSLADNVNKYFSRSSLLLDFNADRELVLNNSRKELSVENIKFLKSYKAKIL